MAQHVARFHMHIDHDIPDMGYEKHGHPRNGGLWVYQMIHFVLLDPYLSIGYIPMYG